MSTPLVIKAETTAADFAAAYVRARKVVRSAATLNAQSAAEDLASKVDDLAQAAGVNLDLITLDEHARIELSA